MLVGNRFRQSLLTHARLWYLINAKDQINGRLAAYIATILQGKTKPIWHPKADVGDFVVVVNTKDIALSGRKWDRKVYRHHTGTPFDFAIVLYSTVSSVQFCTFAPSSPPPRWGYWVNPQHLTFLLEFSKCCCRITRFPVLGQTIDWHIVALCYLVLHIATSNHAREQF